MTIPATSAADIVLPRGETVLAPVNGTVTRVKRYRLYSSYPDVRVELRPEGVPDRRVVMIHLARAAGSDSNRRSTGTSGAVIPMSTWR